MSREHTHTCLAIIYVYLWNLQVRNACSFKNFTKLNSRVATKAALINFKKSEIIYEIFWTTIQKQSLVRQKKKSKHLEI